MVFARGRAVQRSRSYSPNDAKQDTQLHSATYLLVSAFTQKTGEQE